MAADEPFYLDDVSSIESSSQRERKFSEEVIQSLTHAVQRLAAELDTKEAVLEIQAAELDTKEAVLEIQAAELQTQAAELQMKDRLEIENTELKIKNAKLEGQAAEQDTPPRKERPTPPSKDGLASFQRKPVAQGRHDDKENGENVASDDSLAVSTVTKAPLGKPPLGRRRSSGPSLSKLMPRKLLSKPVSGLSGRSLFTNKKSKGSGVLPKLIPRHISALPGSSSDEVSDLSSM